MLKVLGIAFLCVCATAVLYGWLSARRLASARTELPVIVFEAPADDSTRAAKQWFEEQGMSVQTHSVAPDDPLWAKMRQATPKLKLPAYVVGRSIFVEFTPEFAGRIADNEARRALGGGPAESTAPESSDFMVSPAYGVGALSFALFGIAWACFELGWAARAILGSSALLLFAAGLWVTNIPVAMGARVLLLLMGIGGVIFARLRGAHFLG